ncbi:hypothetical protein ACWGE0_11305 [Lentzea sp. NPDC054927]
MGSFKVVPADVAALGELVLRQSSGIASHLAALEHNAVDDQGDGFFGLISHQLVRLRYYAHSNTRQSLTLAGSSSIELRKSAEFYAATDNAAEARLDSTYRAVGSVDRVRSELPCEVTQAGFGDVAEVGNYRPPVSVDLEDDLAWPVDLEKILGALGDAVSAGAKVGGFVKKFTGWNPFERAALIVAGDWNAIYLEARILADTGKAYESIAANIDHGRFNIQSSWDGNAAAAAENWLDDYARACREHARYCREAAEKITALAKAVYHRAKSLEMALNTVIDIVAEVVRIKKLESVTEMFNKAFDLLRGNGDLKDLFKALKEFAGRATALTDVIFATAHEFNGIVEAARGQGEVVAATWPCAPYDHPGVS